jgi:hypothetical protein
MVSLLAFLTEAQLTPAIFPLIMGSAMGFAIPHRGKPPGLFPRLITPATRLAHCRIIMSKSGEKTVSAERGFSSRRDDVLRRFTFPVSFPHADDFAAA